MLGETVVVICACHHYQLDQFDDELAFHSNIKHLSNIPTKLKAKKLLKPDYKNIIPSLPRVRLLNVVLNPFFNQLVDFSTSTYNVKQIRRTTCNGKPQTTAGDVDNNKDRICDL